MKKVFLDCDVVLDLLLDRAPFSNAAQQLFVLIEQGDIKGFVSPLVFSNIFFILRKALGVNKTRYLLHKLRTLVRIVIMNESVVDLALASDFKDFEDGMQYYAACKNKVDCIVTRNVRDYQSVKLPVMDPVTFLQVLHANQFSGIISDL